MTQEQVFPATGMPDREWWRALWPDPEAVIRALCIEPGMTVLDLCCGDGYFTAAIARRVGHGRVIGCDLDPSMLERAQAACASTDNCTWLLGDAMKLASLVERPMDYVLIANTFHGVPGKTALAREVAALLQPHGCFAIVNWHFLPREETTVLGEPRGPRTELRMTLDAVRALVEPAGFVLEACVELPPYHYGALFSPDADVNSLERNMKRCGNPLDEIRARYTDLALRPERDFGWDKGKENARRLGYKDEWLLRLPDAAWESAAGVGNPFALGPIHCGETVVDLGCGAGADACVAALLVTDAGKVYGVDATSAMVVKARNNAEAAGLDRIEFLDADFARLDLPDATADVVISNGAINLAQDKSRVFAEAFRILKKNGRLQFADMVSEKPTASACCGGSSWADCVSGTIGVDEIKTLLREAGFEDVELIGFTGYRTSAATIGATFKARKP